MRRSRQGLQEVAQLGDGGEDVSRDAECDRGIHVDLLVVDEHHLLERDSQLARRDPVDLGIGLDQAELGADEHRLEVRGHRRVPERVGEVEAGVRQQRDARAAGVQLGEQLARCPARR